MADQQRLNAKGWKRSIRTPKPELRLRYVGFSVGHQNNKSGFFLKKFPLGKVSAVDTIKFLTRRNAIAYYVAMVQLRGKTDIEKPKVLSFLSLTDNELLPAVCTWVFSIIRTGGAGHQE
ncbi:elongation factor 1-gamma-like [Armigeres subalbatus]|uniref:elongation factor 1-gamma-like n=1 Tax=Armigeres subalbatus TaxID=124917 RepID=UPI002ED20885